jgi:hypothetical protein
MQFILKLAVLECSFVKHSQGILGCNSYCSQRTALTHPHQILNIFLKLKFIPMNVLKIQFAIFS